MNLTVDQELAIQRRHERLQAAVREHDAAVQALDDVCRAIAGRGYHLSTPGTLQLLRADEIPRPEHTEPEDPADGV